MNMPLAIPKEGATSEETPALATTCVANAGRDTENNAWEDLNE